jgi:hypothetical protein
MTVAFRPIDRILKPSEDDLIVTKDAKAKFYNKMLAV